MALQSFRPLQGNYRTVVMVTGEAILEGEAVAVVSNALEVAADGETVIGIAAASAASGANLAIYIEGEFEGTGASSNSDFNVGDAVYMAASQKLDTGSMGNKAMGICLNNPAANGATVTRFWLTSSLSASLTHA